MERQRPTFHVYLSHGLVAWTFPLLLLSNKLNKEKRWNNKEIELKIFKQNVRKRGRGNSMPQAQLVFYACLIKCVPK